MMIETSLQLWCVFFCCFPFRGEILSRNVGKCSLHIILAKQKLFHAMTANGIEAFLSVLRIFFMHKKQVRIADYASEFHFKFIAVVIVCGGESSPAMLRHQILCRWWSLFCGSRILFVAWPARFESFENSPQLNWIISRKFPNQPKEKTENLLFYIRRKRSKSRKEGSKKRTLLKIHPCMELKIKNKQRMSKKSSICWTLDGFSNNSRGNAAQMWRQSFLEIRVLVQCASQQICFYNSLANRWCRRPTMKCCMCFPLAL